MSRLDYSKWDHIEISDDEDDTHPNIDTPSLFRWRHQARVDRDAERTKKKTDVDKNLTENQQKLAAMKQKIKEAELANASAELEKLKLDIKTLEEQEKEWKEKEAAIEKEIKAAPLNIDTICKEGKSRTIINKSTPEPKVETEDEKATKLQQFVKEKKKMIEKYGLLKKYEDSKNFLVENRELVCEETANHLVLWCINLQIEEKFHAMEHVAHQTIVMQFILQLASSLNVNPKDCVVAFFNRISLSDQQYMTAFNDELEAFKERVRTRAKVRVEEAIKEAEEEERQERLGPGGLDPQEVFESLPEEMQNCFESREIGLLQKVIGKMDPELAEYHMKRCVGSGLWVPNAADAADTEAATGLVAQDESETEIYEEIKEKDKDI